MTAGTTVRLLRPIGLATVAMLLAAGCGGDKKADAQSPGDVAASATAAPDGLRAESFGDVELLVPASWGHQTGDVAAALWCISDAAISAPVVVRPGVPVEQTCPGPEGDGPDPATLMAKAGQFVSMVFAANDPDAKTGTEGDRVTTKLGAVLVRIQAPTDVRTSILSSLHRITTDANGCPITDAITSAPARRPPNPVAVGDLRGITSVAACRYAIPGGQFANPPDDTGDLSDLDSTGDNTGDGADGTTGDGTGVSPDDGSDFPDPVDDGNPTDEPSLDPSDALSPTIAPLLPADTAASAPTLLSSVKVTGDAARDAIARIAAAKTGAGPDSDGGCEGDLANTVRGTEEIVLRVTTATGTSQIYLRYGGCHNGFDDGVTERTLTRDAAAPFVSEANQVPMYGDELTGILDDPNAPATSGHAEEDQAGVPSAPPG